MAYLTRRQTDILRRAMWEKQRDTSLNLQSGEWWRKLHLQIKSQEIKNQEIPELKFAFTPEREESSEEDEQLNSFKVKTIMTLLNVTAVMFNILAYSADVFKTVLDI
eukprot:2354026-Amphidinium_carterae.1